MLAGNLRAFYEIVRTGSVRKASEAMNVAPSSISRQIAVLEHEMGTALFERRAGGMVLTHAGELVAEYARTTLVDYDTLRADLDDLRGAQRRLLRVAMVESIASYGPVEAMARFREKYPDTSFSLRLLPAPRVTEAVLKDQCDIGVAFCAEPHPDLVRVSGASEPIVAALRADHPLSAAKSLELSALADIPLALPEPDFGIRQIVDRAAAAQGFRFQPAMTSNAFETLRDYVRSGQGGAILPYRAVAREAKVGVMAAVALTGAAFSDTTVDLIVLRKRRLPRVVKLFLDMLAQAIAAPP